MLFENDPDPLVDKSHIEEPLTPVRRPS